MNALDTPNKSLFLSYSRVQTQWCNELYTAIDEDTHFQRWRDNKIPESSDWWNTICLNIEGCFAFVAILSKEYLDSAYCMGELDYALKLNKPVIALMLQEVDYPASLNAQRLQFARVGALEMPRVINKVLNACNQIKDEYMQGNYSLDIHPRPHLRPLVPVPTKVQTAPKEDQVLRAQIEELSSHGQIPTLEIVRRFTEEKGSNLRLARDLLNKIAQRKDVPIYFDVDEENAELQVAEAAFAEAERQSQILKKIRAEYAGLVLHVKSLSPAAAIKAIRRFRTAYPDFGDPEDLLGQFVSSVKKLLPASFDWCEIPTGKVMLTNTWDDNANYVGKKGESKTFDVAAFLMAKYPVTNAQYKLFVDAGGYQNPQWWTDAGWQQKEAEKWTEPRYWQDSQWNEAEQPVVGVSWYESMAFCLWLSEKTGEKISLPTEQQWQVSAQGDDGRAYPWGNDWDAEKCQNSLASQISKKTSSVTYYESKGNLSPYQVVDMGGNVWEWCLTQYQNDINGTIGRVLRGGSWFHTDTDYFRCDYRIWAFPRFGSDSFGFRISRFNLGF